MTPIPDGHDRGRNGRFLPGNPGGPGRRAGELIVVLAHRLQSALEAEASPDDLRAIIRQIIDAAKNGDVGAARLLFDRLSAPPVQAELIEEIGELRAFIESQRSAGKD